ncbi:ABC transporter substrate-binding protein [Paenibacillus xanthanilyticus]|uniref:ABC transporter substrate-binding protein n=1 Tax=Paenibacillus xanthanilyticus TaxID=1783531 RepID=A0ABV8JV04_9BACL
MSKRSRMLLAVSMASMMLLSACGGSNGNSGNAESGTNAPANNAPANNAEKEAEKPAEAEPVSLRVFSTFGGTDAARESFQALIDEFTAKYPNVTVNNDTMSANDDSFRTKVNTDMNSGNEPDLLFYFVGKDAEGFVNAGKVVPLDELLEADATWKNGYLPTALEAVRQPDGKIYAAPLTGFYEGLFVNKKIFADNGLELPTDWTKLTTAVKTLSAKGIIPLSGPFDQSHYLIEHAILSGAGAEGQKSGLAGGVNPDWETGLGALKELYDLGAFPKDAATIDLGMAANYYSQGLAAMIIEGSWALGGFEESVRNETTVLPFPTVPGGKGTGKDIVGGFGTGFYLSKKTFDDAKKKDMAIALMKHLTSPDAIKKVSEANGGTPAADVQPEGLGQATLDGFKMAAEATSINAPVDSQIDPETFTTIRAGIQPIVKGEKTPKAALEEAQKIEASKQ